MSPSTSSTSSETSSRFSRRPVAKLSRTLTSWPSCSRRSTRCDPMNPPPPVTSALTRVQTSERMDVTVVIPAWGDYAGDLLDEALESLRAQDLDARIVIVDNAAAPPLRERPGVELLRAPARLSVGAARNLGLEHVQTPYVMFWDADDLMLPGALRLLRDHLASEPDVVLASA